MINKLFIIFVQCILSNHYTKCICKLIHFAYLMNYLILAKHTPSAGFKNGFEIGQRENGFYSKRTDRQTELHSHPVAY